jgi:putative transposase
MPNHVHGIIIFTRSLDGGTVYGGGKACLAPTGRNHPQRKFGKPIAGSLATVVGSFKSAATKNINRFRNAEGTPVWQRNYYEHIVRNDRSLQHLRQYIQNNPLSWDEDQLHPDCLSPW